MEVLTRLDMAAVVGAAIVAGCLLAAILGYVVDTPVYDDEDD